MLRMFALAAIAVAATGSVALAADLDAPQTPQPVVASAGGGFDGFYAGLQAGGYGEDGLDTEGFAGGVVGYNFTADTLLLGLEVQANHYFENDSFDSADELFVLGKAGVVVSKDLAIYATAGAGHAWEAADFDYAEYAFGIGAELKVTNDLGIRGDLLKMGFDDGEGFVGTRGSIGAFWHF